MAEATMVLGSRPTSTAEFAPLRASAMSAPGSFHGRAHPHHGRKHQGVGGVPARQELRRIAADRLADIVMEVAVTEMPERHRPRARDQLYYRSISLGDEGRDGGDRYRDVVLDRAAFGF